MFVDILFELTKTVFVNSTSNITTNIETAALSSQTDRMGGGVNPYGQPDRKYTVF